MVESRGWDWENANQSPWLKPCEDGTFLAYKWSNMGSQKVLDLGTGLGRHAILFAQQGLEVSALDISEYGINHLKGWAENEGLNIDAVVGDMLALPYDDNSFDCVFIYHAISHGDTTGVKKIISEIERVLRPGGELFTSMCSKDAFEFEKAGFPKLDENTVVNTDEGPEKGVPHFFANVDDILELFSNFDIERIKHTDYCYMNSKKLDCKYYYISGRKK